MAPVERDRHIPVRSPTVQLYATTTTKPSGLRNACAHAIAIARTKTIGARLDQSRELGMLKVMQSLIDRSSGL